MPYASKAQERYFHAAEARGEISKKTVREFDKASKGKRLPERKGEKMGEGNGFKGEFTHSEHGRPGSHEQSNKKSGNSAVRTITTGSPDEQEMNGYKRASHDGKPGT